MKRAAFAAALLSCLGLSRPSRAGMLTGYEVLSAPGAETVAVDITGPTAADITAHFPDRFQGQIVLNLDVGSSGSDRTGLLTVAGYAAGALIRVKGSGTGFEGGQPGFRETGDQGHPFGIVMDLPEPKGSAATYRVTISAAPEPPSALQALLGLPLLALTRSRRWRARG